MKLFVSLTLWAYLVLPLTLSAESQLEDNLRSVMLLFEKNRKDSQLKIEQLTKANEELVAGNQTLEADLAAARGKLQSLEQENLLLRSKISERAVQEIETAALAMQSESSVEPPSGEAPIPDFTPQAFKTTDAPTPGAVPLSSATTLVVNLNSATEREIRLIPGIGPQMAQRIVEARPFSSIWDLMRIQGMGRKRIETISPYITIE